MVDTMFTETNERRDLRAAIDAQLRTEGDLDAFFIDFFPDVHRRFGSGMQRDARVNLLFTLVEAEEIADRLSFSAKPGRRSVTRWKWAWLAVAVVVGWTCSWIAQRWEGPHFRSVMPISIPADEQPISSEPVIETYPAVDEPNHPVDMQTERQIDLSPQVSGIRLKQNAEVGLRVLNYHWANKESGPPILDAIIENKTTSSVIFTSINVNVVEYYPANVFARSALRPEAIVDINLPEDIGNHIRYLADPIEIPSGRISRIKFRFLDPRHLASVSRKKKPYYKFELGINMANSSALVIKDLSLSKTFP